MSEKLFPGLTLVWSELSFDMEPICLIKDFDLVSQYFPLRISAKENIDRRGQKFFLGHIGPKTNDNPDQTKVRTEKSFSDTP